MCSDRCPCDEMNFNLGKWDNIDREVLRGFNREPENGVDPLLINFYTNQSPASAKSTRPPLSASEGKKVSTYEECFNQIINSEGYKATMPEKN